MTAKILIKGVWENLFDLSGKKFCGVFTRVAELKPKIRRSSANRACRGGLGEIISSKKEKGRSRLKRLFFGLKSDNEKLARSLL